ncbi:MAG: hypothetical protein OSJ58_10370 [Dysosmobacter sp.]|nr:hypothetical protein [Dysosmobacter sp.]
MKKIRQLILFTFVLLLFMTSIATSASAAENASPQIHRFEDGSYVVVTIDTDQPLGKVAFAAGNQIISGTKNYSYYNDSNNLVLVFRVHGTFEYDGITSSAVGASYSYDIYDSNWSFLNANATCSGATATATGSFVRFLVPKSITASLTCSPNGILS